MQFDQVLHKFVGKSLLNSDIRLTKTNAVIDITKSILNESQLTLTSLGRHLSGPAHVKHKIKRVDRWLGSKGLYKDSFKIYKAIFRDLLAHRKHLEILVDWSGCCNWTEATLRASLAYKGRSITIYQEVWDSRQQQKSKVHQQFLKNLKELIPKNCEVTIITDRGFGFPWFKMVKENAWHYIGRVKGDLQFQTCSQAAWLSVKSLYKSSLNKPKFVTKAWFGKSKKEQSETYLYSYKEKAKNRKRHRVRNKPSYSQLNKTYSDMNTTPWVLATSLEGGKSIANKVINGYALRMQIEQNFRDDKNERWGFGMQFSRTTSPERMTILLMVAAIASYVLLIIGAASEKMNLHWRFQANTVRDRRVLSLITLAKQVIRHLFYELTIPILIESLKKIAKARSI